MIKKLYTFTGSTTALRFYINRSTAPDKAAALTACAQLTGVSDPCSKPSATTPARKPSRNSAAATSSPSSKPSKPSAAPSVNQELNDTFLSLLEYFYTAADALAGGGGNPSLPIFRLLRPRLA